MCLLNAVFSDDFFDDIVKVNDRKYMDELEYAGKVGMNQCRWSSKFNKYNDLANNEVFGVFAFVEDEQIGEFAKDVEASTTYMKLDWIKATTWFKTTWFKAILMNYEVVLN
jgi:hypothetical protein